MRRAWLTLPLMTILAAGAVFLIYRGLAQSMNANLDKFRATLPKDVQFTWARANPSLLVRGIALHDVNFKSGDLTIHADYLRLGHPHLQDDAFLFSSVMFRQTSIDRTNERGYLHAKIENVVFRKLKISPAETLDNEKNWERLILDNDSAPLSSQEQFKELTENLFADPIRFPSIDFLRVRVTGLALDRQIVAPPQPSPVKSQKRRKTAHKPFESDAWDDIEHLTIDDGVIEGFGEGEHVHVAFEGLKTRLKACRLGGFSYPAVQGSLSLSVDRFNSHDGDNILSLGPRESTETNAAWHFRNDPFGFLENSPEVLEFDQINLKCLRDENADLDFHADNLFFQKQIKTTPKDRSRENRLMMNGVTLETPLIPKELRNVIAYPLTVRLQTNTKTMPVAHETSPLWISNLSLDLATRNMDRIQIQTPVIYHLDTLRDLMHPPYDEDRLKDALDDMHWGKIVTILSGEDLPKTVYAYLSVLNPADADRMGILTLNTLDAYKNEKPFLGTMAEWLRHPANKSLYLKWDSQRFDKTTDLPAPAFLPDLPIDDAVIQ